jgi:hypothetical protein
MDSTTSNLRRKLGKAWNAIRQILSVRGLLQWLGLWKYCAAVGTLLISLALGAWADVGGLSGPNIALIVIASFCLITVIGSAIFQIMRPTASGGHKNEGWFALETPEQIHNYIPVEVFITNVGPRSVRNIRFDPVISRHKSKLWFHTVPALAKDKRVRLGIGVGDMGNQLASAGNIVSFFEGGTTPATDPPPYPLVIRFLDGLEERTEPHVVEGYPLAKGGASFKIVPAGNSGENKASKSLEKRTKQLADDLFALLREQGPEPLNPLRFKGSQEEQRGVFNAYFDWKRNTFFKYMAHFRDRVVKIDYELAAAGTLTGLDYKEIDPPPSSQEVDVKKIAETLLLVGAQIPRDNRESTRAAG